MKKKIVITGGHLTPALAVIDELVKQGSWEIYFLGRKYASEREKTPSMEAKIIPERGIWFFPITAGRFPRLLNRYALLSALKLPLGFLQALYYLLKIKPKVVLSFGGYVSVPVVFSAWLMRIPSLTHEQTTVQGLATKINQYFVKKVAVSWARTIKDYPSNKAVLTGNPIEKEIFKTNDRFWRVLRFPPKLPLVFVTGGNQGSHMINLSIEEALPRLLEIANVFHQCGHLLASGDFQRLEEAREKLPERLQKRYHVKKYLSREEMGSFLKKADLVISRAGANTLSEIAALGKAALFIPIPWQYQDEQTQNAQMLVETGVAKILPQKDLSGQSLLLAVREMIKNIKKYEANSAKAKKLIKLNAAQRIVREVEKIA